MIVASEAAKLSGTGAAIMIAICVVMLALGGFVFWKALSSLRRLQQETPHKKMTHRQRVVVVVLIATELVFVAAGAVIGYEVASGSRLGSAFAGGFLGGAVWVVACWLVAGVFRKPLRSRLGPTAAS